MYARNNASPRPITIGAVVQISDGAVQTTDVSVKVRKDAGSWATGAGTLAVEEGIWSYTPTQGETDCDALQIIVYKTSCIPNSMEVVFTDSSEFGQVVVATNNDKTGYSLTQSFPANFASLGINASGHVSRVVLVDTTTTNTDMRGTDGAALATNWTATRAGYLDGVLIASNYNQRTVQVTGSNHVAADIHELQPAVIDNTHFAAGAIDSNAIAADAVTEIQNGLALESSSQTILARIGAFAGSGVNTILGFFRALLRSDAGITTPSDVGGTFTHTTDSTQAIRDRGDAAWITGAGGGGGSTTVNVLPYTGAVPDRVEGTTIKVFYNELTNVSVGVTDATGAAVTLDAKTLRFCVEDRYGVDVLTLNDGDITRSGSTFTVQIPQSLTDTVGANYRWSLRDLTGSLNTVLIHGQMIVAEAAEDEA